MTPGRPFAAVLACAALVLAGCNDDGDRDASAPTSTRPAGGVTTTATGADRYHRVGEARDLGPGQVVGVSADGTAALVFAEDPAANRMGCEGVPAQFLWTVPLDATKRKRAIAGPFQPGSSELLRSRSGSVVLVERCEEFLSGIVTATEGDRGRLEDLTPVRVPATDFAPDVSWAADGRSLIVVLARAGPDGNAARTAVRLDPASGRTETLASDPDLVGAVETADGTLVLARRSNGGRSSVTWGDRTHDLDAFDLVVAPDGDTVAVAGATGLQLLDADGAEKLADGTVYTATWSADGRALAFTRSPAAETPGRLEVLVATRDGRTTTVAADAGFSAAYFSPQGDGLVFSRARPGTGPEGDPFDEPFAAVVDLG